MDNTASGLGSHLISKISMVEDNALAGTCDGGGCEMALNYDIYCIRSGSIAIAYRNAGRVHAC